ncbi:MFS transporter [Salmonella enterica subsp. enterica serovar Bareilly str. CFSAN001105]|nr:MFS transporter [Salmonella enterica subsp. enterica serovar Bareilly str. CFSAN001105]
MKHERSTQDLVRAAVSGWLGTALEFMDFQLYSLGAALVFHEIFFPEQSAAMALILAMGTYGAGYIARIIGAFVFGKMGDRIGRKKVLFITITMMGICTTLIGVLPTYAQIGIFAPVLLVTLRIIQGLGAGAEISGAGTMLAEYAPKGKRGIISSLVAMGTNCGTLSATAIWAVMFFALEREQLIAWGWRIPFLLSALLVLPGLYMRHRLDETPVFRAFKKQQAINHRQQREERPVVKVVREQWRSILLIIILRFAESVPFFLATVFAVSWATTQLGIASLTILYIVMFTCLLAYPMHVLFGIMSDRRGCRQVYIFGALFVAAMAFPFFWLLESRSLILMTMGYVLLINIGHNSLNAVQPSFFAGLFHPPVRYSGSSIGAQLGAVVAGGFTPFIAKALSAVYDNSWTLVAGYVVLTALASAFAAKIAPETVLPHSP